VFIEAKGDGGGGGNWTTEAISRAKVQSNQHPVFYRPDALPVTQPTVSKH